MTYKSHWHCAPLCHSEGGESYIILGHHGKALPGVLQGMIFVYKCQGPMCCCASSRDYNCLHLEKTLRLSNSTVRYYLCPQIIEWHHPQITLHIICSLLEKRGMNINNTSSWPCVSGRTVKHSDFLRSVFLSNTSLLLTHHRSFQLSLLATSCSFEKFPIPM